VAALLFTCGQTDRIFEAEGFLTGWTQLENATLNGA
jgi:hypothetical protein